MTAMDQHTDNTQSYVRFTPVERMEHMTLIVTFTVLGLTGLVQRYAGTAVGESLIALMGGIEGVRIIHRIMATILMAQVIFHGGIVSYRLFVLGKRPSMLPSWKDVTDIFQWIGYNLGIRKEHPKMPRYNFGEKAEYLAVVWGTLIMVITGFMLWNPITTSTFLPGQVIPAAQLAHSAEAVLAVLSILIWHMYNVHLKYFNRSMFTGKMNHEMMAEEHGEELERIMSGDDPTEPRLSPEVIAKRRRIFLPYAVVMSVLLSLGLVWFVTSETTALETVPRRAIAADPAELTALIESDAENAGEELWIATGCAVCHGDQGQAGEGLLGVQLANTSLDLETFTARVRRGPADMPAISEETLNDEGVEIIWEWLTSLDAE